MLSATWLPPAIFKCVLSFQHIINCPSYDQRTILFLSIYRWTKLWHLSKYHIHLPLLHLLYTTNYSHLQCKMQWIHCRISNCRNLTWNCIGYLYYSFVHILSKKAVKTEIKRRLKSMTFIWMQHQLVLLPIYFLLELIACMYNIKMRRIHIKISQYWNFHTNYLRFILGKEIRVSRSEFRSY